MLNRISPASGEEGMKESDYGGGKEDRAEMKREKKRGVRCRREICSYTGPEGEVI